MFAQANCTLKEVIDMINYKNLSRDTKGVVSELFYSKGFGGNFSRSFIGSVLGEDYIKDVINRATRAGIQMEFVNEIKKRRHEIQCIKRKIDADFIRGG